MEYEVLIETINPCGGDRHSTKEFVEVTCESPEAYVAEHGRYPVMTTGKTPEGDVVITTGDGTGSMVRYTFTAAQLRRFYDDLLGDVAAMEAAGALPALLATRRPHPDTEGEDSCYTP